jgi:hypothetical protein
MQPGNPIVYYNVSKSVFCLAKYFESIDINGDIYQYDEETDSLVCPEFFEGEENV